MEEDNIYWMTRLHRLALATVISLEQANRAAELVKASGGDSRDIESAFRFVGLVEGRKEQIANGEVNEYGF